MYISIIVGKYLRVLAIHLFKICYINRPKGVPDENVTFTLGAAVDPVKYAVLGTQQMGVETAGGIDYDFFLSSGNY